MFFFFQAEDGIRDGRVTGVQTCALPIFSGFSGDGWTWSLTATFDKTMTTEEGVATGPDGAIVTSRIDWQFSSDGKALSGTQQSEQNGVRWTAFTVKGTKSR